jgi:predicted Fe-Mo cluster-binding NifX family protein
MEISGNTIIVRSVRSEFVRIIGLKPHERDILAKGIRRLRDMELDISIVIQYGLNGWLEVRAAGIHKYVYRERVKLTDALKERIVKIIKKPSSRKR